MGILAPSEPSSRCDDVTFLRRASLDVMGTLPTADEVVAFLNETAADKRARAVDQLLERDEYVDYWTIMKAFTRTLPTSELYQRSGEPNAANSSDQQNFSHFLQKTLPAEVLLDAISQSTSVREEFNGWPEGDRAIQVWDNRMPPYFFRIFGRPVRATVCECKRGSEPSIAQALHLLNAPEITAEIGHRHCRVRRLAASEKSPVEIIDELYLSMLSRLPVIVETRVLVVRK